MIENAVCDLKDTLFSRLSIFSIIQSAIVNHVEGHCLNTETGAFFLNIERLVGYVVEDCKQEIVNTFEEVQQT